MKFSIIIPVYNIAPFIGECVDSVLNQSCGDWECICVDDGSTDGSGRILDQYSAKDDRIRIVHQRNAGVGCARNAGMSLAKGEYVWFVDGDDLIAEDALNRLGRIIDECDPDGVTFGFHRRTSGAKSACYETAIGDEKIRYYALDDGHAALAYAWCVGSLLVCNCVFRHSTIDGLRFCGLKNGEDIVFGTMAFLRCGTFVSSAIRPYVYTDRPGSAMYNKVTVSRFSDAIESAAIVAEETKKWRHYSGAVSKALARKLVTLSIGWIFTNWKHLDRKDREIVRKLMFHRLVPAFDGVGMVGKVFGLHSMIALRLFLWLPWKMKALLMKVPVVRRMRGGR